jgi:hypothetical protein
LRKQAPLLSEQSRVREWSTDQVGTVVRLGAEVSEVRLDDGQIRFVTNHFLELDE